MSPDKWKLLLHNDLSRCQHKAVPNEADLRRFQFLMTGTIRLDGNTLEAAIEEARQGSTQEIEPLRDVAYNDVVLEFKRPGALIPPSPLQKILRVFA